MVVGLTLALARLSTKRYAKLPATIVVEFFRGTPLIFQLFVAYYVLPSFGLRLDAFVAA